MPCECRTEEWLEGAKWEWKDLEEMSRIRVPGGWLYREQTDYGDDGVAVALAFVPHPCRGKEQPCGP